MTKVIYDVVEHDGGWAYRVNGVYSETFPTHRAAREAADRAAREQAFPGETTDISYEAALIRMAGVVEQNAARCFTTWCLMQSWPLHKQNHSNWKKSGYHQAGFKAMNQIVALCPNNQGDIE